MILKDLIMYINEDQRRFVDILHVKTKHKTRRIINPNSTYRTAQKLLLSLLENYKLKIHDSAYGWRRGRSRTECAALHVGKKVVMDLDLKNYFDQIDDIILVETFLNNGITDIAGIDIGAIAHFLTFPWDNKRIMPQGFLTSPLFANIVRYNLDVELEAYANSKNLTYTSYGDNLIFSGDVITKNEKNEIISIIESHNFKVNRRKCHIMPYYTRQSILGYVVNEKLNVAKEYYEKVFKHIISGIKRGTPPSKHVINGYKNVLKVNNHAYNYLNKLQGIIGV